MSLFNKLKGFLSEIKTIVYKTIDREGYNEYLTRKVDYKNQYVYRADVGLKFRNKFQEQAVICGLGLEGEIN